MIFSIYLRPVRELRAYNIDINGENRVLFVGNALFLGVFCAVEAVFPIKWRFENMFWTLELASSLDDAPWPASKDELIDYANRSGAPEEVIENLQELEDDGEVYESIEDIWPDYPTKDDFFFNEEEY